MLSPYYYNIIYIIFIAILTIWCMFKYSTYPSFRIEKADYKGPIIPSLILSFFVIIFLGFRPLSYAFVDMMNYNEMYNYLLFNQNNFEFNLNRDNYIFNNLFEYLASNLFDITIFFFIMAILYIFCMLYALKKIFPNDLFYSFIIYLGAFSTFSYGTNGLKAGVAASLFLLVFAFYRKPLIAALFCFISIGFHHSMSLPIIAFVMAYFIKNPKWFFFGWLLCLFLSFFQIEAITDFLAEFADDKGRDYLLNSIDETYEGKSGFRFDFILYGLPPILIGIWTIYRHNISDRLYLLLLNTYLVTNGIWILCMYIPFNNRIAYLSWFILPVVSIYPFLKLKLHTRQYIQLNYVVSIYLAFTIFSQLFI